MTTDSSLACREARARRLAAPDYRVRKDRRSGLYTAIHLSTNAQMFHATDVTLEELETFLQR